MGYWTNRGTGIEPRTWREWWRDFCDVLIAAAIASTFVVGYAVLFPSRCTMMQARGCDPAGCTDRK